MYSRLWTKLTLFALVATLLVAVFGGYGGAAHAAPASVASFKLPAHVIQIQLPRANFARNGARTATTPPPPVPLCSSTYTQSQGDAAYDLVNSGGVKFATEHTYLNLFLDSTTNTLCGAQFVRRVFPDQSGYYYGEGGVGDLCSNNANPLGSCLNDPLGYYTEFQGSYQAASYSTTGPNHSVQYGPEVSLSVDIAKCVNFDYIVADSKPLSGYTDEHDTWTGYCF